MTVRPDVARVGNGTRRRAGLTFSLQPTYLMVVPPEVSCDPFLEIVEIAPPPPAEEPDLPVEALPAELAADEEPPPPAPAPAPSPKRGRGRPRKARG
ncbi:MAG TPA: hypothetical protein PKO05_00730 [Thermoanaerobaculia bacterium]|nr:hypothetical protein [Thermoanaerobaculia bacterium]